MALVLFAAASCAVAASPPPPPPSRIALLHMYDGVSFFQRLGSLTGANKARYAARHGYDMVTRTPSGARGIFRSVSDTDCAAPPCWEDDTSFAIDASRAPTFGKLALTLAACNNRPNSWLLWSDADAMIVNQTTPLEAIIDDGYDVMVSYDWLMLQAGVILFKCSPWTIEFVKKVYGDREFDKARALDQSALESYINGMSAAERDAHVKAIPKHAFNVYPEEYRPGDFLVHMAGKLYEATEPGLWAIANQLDIFSAVDNFEDIAAFFDTRYLLNYYSGVCPVKPGERQSGCNPDDERRIRLKEPLSAMASPNRYHHVALRYHFLQRWIDKYDIPGWNDNRRKIIPVSSTIDEPVLPPPAFVEEPAVDGNHIVHKNRAELAVDDQRPATSAKLVHITAPFLELSTRTRAADVSLTIVVQKAEAEQTWLSSIFRLTLAITGVPAVLLFSFVVVQRQKRRQNFKRR
jgi:hypothetical protein